MMTANGMWLYKTASLAHSVSRHPLHHTLKIDTELRAQQQP